MHRVCEITKNPKITGIYSAFIRNFDPDYRFRGESHDFWELVCVTEGRVNLTAGNKIIELKKGQAIFHPPMQFHNIHGFSGEPFQMAVFSFSGENIPPLEDKIFEIGDLSKVKALNESAEKYYNIRRGYSIRSPKEKGDAHLIYVKQLELFILELENHRLEDDQLPSQSAKNYTRIIDVMQENIDKRLSVSRLADLCNMSEINLQKTFSRYAGVGVMGYFNRLKMRQADIYLKSGMSVKETALKLGFHDQNYFSTVFKRIIGHPPSQSI